MNKVVVALFLSVTLGLVPVMAQEKKDMPMKGEEIPPGGMMMGKMKDMQSKIGEMKKGMSGAMRGQGMMKSEEMKGMEKMMANMSGMMSDMGKMMGSGQTTPDEMKNLSKMMGDMSGMVKQMSERMKTRMGKPD